MEKEHAVLTHYYFQYLLEEISVLKLEKINIPSTPRFGSSTHSLASRLNTDLASHTSFSESKIIRQSLGAR